MVNKGLAGFLDRSKSAAAIVERDSESSQSEWPNLVKRQLGGLPAAGPPSGSPFREQPGASGPLSIPGIPGPPASFRLPATAAPPLTSVPPQNTNAPPASSQEIPSTTQAPPPASTLTEPPASSESSSESTEDGKGRGDQTNSRGKDDDRTDDNPFASTAAGTPQSTDARFTTNSDPFLLTLPTVSFGSSTPGAFYTSVSLAALSPLSDPFSPATTSTDTTLPPSLFPFTSPTSSPTLQSFRSRSATVAGMSSGTPATTELPVASNHPIAKAAIVVPSVIGCIIAIAAIFLLCRYCAPIRARWFLFRARRGTRLSEVEDGTAREIPPPMTDAYATRTAGVSRASSLPSTPITSDPSVVQGTAIALPVTTTRAPPPVLVRALSKDLPQRPIPGHPPPYRNYGGTMLPPVARNFSRTSASLPTGINAGLAVPTHARTNTGSHPPPLARNNSCNKYPPLSRSNSANNAKFSYGTTVFNFTPQEYAPRAVGGHKRHPSGLNSNPPTPVLATLDESARPESAVTESNHGGPDPTIITSESGLGLSFPAPPKTPSPPMAHYIPKTPPESVVGDSPPRMRKSITPSESVSNIPDSPTRLSSWLIPPVPIVNSRWSKNSSSMQGRLLAEALALPDPEVKPGASEPVLPMQSNARPLSRFPSLQSSSAPIRGGSQ